MAYGRAVEESGIVPKEASDESRKGVKNKVSTEMLDKFKRSMSERDYATLLKCTFFCHPAYAYYRYRPFQLGLYIL